MKYSTLQYRAMAAFLRDAMSKGQTVKGEFKVDVNSLKELCTQYLQPVGLRMKENKGARTNTVSIERNIAE